LADNANSGTSFTPRIGTTMPEYPLGASPGQVSGQVYTDPERYARETSAVLSTTWLLADRSESLADPRDYLVWEAFGQTVIIARQDDTSLKAFHNVCQHRGARIAASSGHCETGQLVCPWHGFRYDLEGNVIAIPLRDAFGGEQIRDLKSPSVQVEEWAGFIWLNLNPDAEPLRQYAGEIYDELEPYALEQWDLYGAGEWEINANWKAVVDAFNEAYHIPDTHKSTVKGGLLWQQCIYKLFGIHSMMIVPLSSENVHELEPPVDHHKHALVHYLLFPNTVFNIFPNHGQVFCIQPTGPTTTKMRGWTLATREPPAGTNELDWVERNRTGFAHFGRVAQEDVFVLNEFGAASNSIAYKRNIFNLAESRLTAFHENIDMYLGATND
jgi:choline monooxygenase